MNGLYPTEEKIHSDDQIPTPGKSTLVFADVSESLEQLWAGLLAKFYANRSLWKTRRFNVYVFTPYAPFEDQIFEHVFAAGGL